ncbi:MAG: SIS domain-containing protein [Trueperaceae bacterium]
MTPHIDREIRTQGAAWRSALQVLRERADALSDVLERARGREVRFLGSGSSYYLGVAASNAWGRRGWSARALPSAEQVLHADAFFTTDAPLAVAVSRSGATTETLRAIEILKRAGSPVVGITTRRGTPMDEICDVVVHLTGADERSTVQTRSFSSQFLVVQALARLAAEGEEALAAFDVLPNLAEAWIDEADAYVSAFADRFERVYVLGTGTRWGLAMEGALKLKETSLTESEAFQTLEFRHGPKSMVDSETLVLGLVGAGTRDAELPVLREMRALGATVVAIGPGLAVEDGFSPLSFPADLPPDVEDVLFLPPMQLLAYRRGVAKGLDPDHPRHLSFAVELEGI